MSRRPEKIDPARIVVVDDHPVVRLGLSQVISDEPDMTVCGEAADAPEALELVAREEPDLAVVDISLEGANGLELIKRIKASHGDVKMLVSSMHDETLFAERALAAGAMGYINKEEAVTDIVGAIRKVLSGRIYLSSRMTDRMLQTVAGSEVEEGSTPVSRLSDRELEVFSLIGRALTTRQVAERLGVSVKTVESHREHIKEKLGLAHHNELIRRAVEWVLRDT